MPCPCCQAEAPVSQVLARATDSWPNQRWIMFACPSCGDTVHAEVLDGVVNVGQLDGGPGPVLIVSRTIHPRGFTVEVHDDGIALALDDVRYWVPARR